MKSLLILLLLALLCNAQPAAESKPEDRCALEGQVLNAATGEPVRKVSLTLMRADTQGPSTRFGTSTDASGKFAMKDLEPGRYRLLAQRAGFVAVQYGARGAMQPGTEITLVPGQALTDLKLRLTPHAVITGRVVDEDREPVAYVQVMAMRYRYNPQGGRQLTPLGSASTNDLGEYRIFGVPPGRYTLSANARGIGMRDQTVDRSAVQHPDEDYVMTYYPGAIDPASAAPVEVAAGAQIGGMDFRLSKIRTARIRGRVTNTTGARQPITVMLTPRDRGFMYGGVGSREPVTDPSGAFEIRGVAPGSYSLAAMVNDGPKFYNASTTVDVGGSDVENITLAIRPGFEIGGQFRIDGDTPFDLSRVRVSLLSQNPVVGAQPGAGANAQGAFTMTNVNADQYRVSVLGLPDVFYVKSVRLGDDSRDYRRELIDLTKGSAGPIEIVLSGTAGQVTGTVVDEKSQPVAGATVVLVPQEKERRENFQAYRNANTDQYGRFTIKSVEPGEYKALAWEAIEYGAYMDPDVLKPVETRGEQVTMKENGREDLQLKVIPANLN